MCASGGCSKAGVFVCPAQLINYLYIINSIIHHRYYIKFVLGLNSCLPVARGHWCCVAHVCRPVPRALLDPCTQHALHPRTCGVCLGETRLVASLPLATQQHAARLPVIVLPSQLHQATQARNIKDMYVQTNKFQGEQLTSGPGHNCTKCSGVYTVLGRSPNAGKRFCPTRASNSPGTR